MSAPAAPRPGERPTLPVVEVTVAAPGLAQDLRAVKVVMQRELIRFGQDRTRMVSAMVQPVLFLFVLAAGLSSLTRGSTGGLDLRTFMFPGVLATSTLFTAMFSAISIVWDREFGFLREMLVAPVRRSSIMVGKCLGGAVVATLQGCLILVLAPFVGVTLTPLLVLQLLGILMLLSFMLTALGLVISARVQQLQSVMGIMQMLLLPLSFLSGALYPIDQLPRWLDVAVHLNPITYGVFPVRHAVFGEVDAPRATLDALNPPLEWFGWPVPVGVQLALVATLGVVFLAVAVRQFDRTE